MHVSDSACNIRDLTYIALHCDCVYMIMVTVAWWLVVYRIIICLRSLSKFTTVICKKQGSYREMEYAVWKLYSYFQYMHVIFTWNYWFTCFLQWNCPFVFIVHGRRHIESFSALTRKRLKLLLRVYAARHKNYAL